MAVIGVEPSPVSFATRSLKGAEAREDYGSISTGAGKFWARRSNLS